VKTKGIHINLPKIDSLYWIMILLATTIGEIAGNLISRNLGLGYSTGSMLLIGTYLLSIIAIIMSGVSNVGIYWLLIVLGNIAGTNCADFITITPLALGTIWGSVLVMVVLFAILFIWKFIAPESTLQNGLNGKTFLLYWLAILVSSTFGTTSGDYLSNDTPLGAGGGTLLLLFGLLLLLLAERYTSFSKEVLYWTSLVVMHPIGATTGNYISKPAGLNFGNIWTSVVLWSLFFGLLYLSSRKQSQA
jgi:uncharacterized membrane-anchored protein